MRLSWHELYHGWTNRVKHVSPAMTHICVTSYDTSGRRKPFVATKKKIALYDLTPFSRFAPPLREGEPSGFASHSPPFLVYTVIIACKSAPSHALCHYICRIITSSLPLRHQNSLVWGGSGEPQTILFFLWLRLTHKPVKQQSCIYSRSLISSPPSAPRWGVRTHPIPSPISF